MAKKNVWLNEDTAELLKLARLKYLKDNTADKVTNDLAIKKALGVYVNGFTKTRNK